MRLPFFGGAYEGRSKSVNAERCLNFYLEKQGEDWILVGTPGLTLRLTANEGPWRGLYRFGDHIIGVSGTAVYRINALHEAVQVGTLATISSRVFMADNGTQLLLVDGSSAGYKWDGSTFSQITSSNFNGGVSASFQDGYFIVVEPDTGRFRISELYDIDTWTDTDFATPAGGPGTLKTGITDHRELWLLKDRNGEVWYNSGDSDFPFARTETGFIEKGIAASSTLIKLDNSLAWLSADERGHALAVQVVDGYRPQIVSPTGVNWQFSQYTTISDAFSFSYQIEGHEFWVVTFPTANATWVFDAATKQWHQWSSNLSDNPLSRHRANCHVFAFDRHYVGDYASGKLYSIEPEVYTEDGAAIIRDRIGQHANADEELVGISSVQIVFEEGVGIVTGQGSDPKAMLRWSKDGGKSWSNELWRAVGKLAESRVRAIWRKLGKAYSWTFWLRVSDPVKWIVRGAVGKIRGVEADAGA